MGEEMNGYQRMVAALKLQEPDRVPIMEWIIHPKVIQGLCPGGSLYDVVAELDLDGIGVGGGHLHLDAQEETFRDAWGVVFKRTAEAYAPVEGPIKSAQDLAHYSPPDPAAVNLDEVTRAIGRFKGKKFIVFHSRAAFMTAAYLRGLSDLLTDFILAPELARGVLKLAADYNLALGRRAAALGVDAVTLGDDWAFKTAPLMSPTHFREFVFPEFRRVVAGLKEMGVFVLKHSDGYIWPLMDMVVEAGVDAINPIQPDANMDLKLTKEKYGRKLCLIGNIDCGYTLSQAPVEEVVREVKKAILDAGLGGGYVMMSSNSLHSSVRPENYRAMVEATKAYGKYPLDLAALRS